MTETELLGFAETIKRNLDEVLGRVHNAAARSGRDASQVSLVAATKTFPMTAIVAAYHAGVRHFGENYVQEAQQKVLVARETGVDATWHLIGHLQANKITKAATLFDVIQSIDSVKTAEALSRRASQPVRVLLEVNVSAGEARTGFGPEEVLSVAESIMRISNLEVMGLMAIAPMVAFPEDARPFFRKLRELRDSLGLRELSMGMTDDFEIAVEEGSTMVRLGRALFGSRDPADSR